MVASLARLPEWLFTSDGNAYELCYLHGDLTHDAASKSLPAVVKKMNVSNKANKFAGVSRVLAISFVLFLSLFALDAFSGEAPFTEKLIGFLIHLIPSFIFVIPLIIFWKSPRFCGLAYIILSILFVFYFRTYRDFEYFLILSLPQFVVGALFIIAHVFQRSKST
ncbi:MAG: hypothetical protein A4E54_01494 [Pelotomaculum sp. PtaB.Bin117]|nr:MAG: hypothetical protein A4E54_01494 [Pelotomaculum sp. PtaB.Bin117]